jgi:hypothetical protein
MGAPELFALEEKLSPPRCQCHGGRTFWPWSQRSTPGNGIEGSRTEVNGVIRKWTMPSISGSPSRDVLPVTGHRPWTHDPPIIGGTGIPAVTENVPMINASPSVLPSLPPARSRWLPSNLRLD